MIDSQGTENMPEDFFDKKCFDENWQDPKNVDNVEDCDARDDCRHERLEIARFPEKKCKRFYRQSLIFSFITKTSF